MKVRFPVISALSLLAIILGLGYEHYHDSRSMWAPLTPAVTLIGPFEDLQTITFSIDCQRAGRDPYISWCDPGGRPLNYPPLWLLLGRLGVSASRTGFLGALFCSMIAAAMMVLFTTRKLFSGACVFAAVFSRPLVLAMERANTDVVIFSLLVMICAVTPLLKARIRGGFLTIGVIVLTCLKIYPIVTSIALLKSRRTVWYMLGAVTLSILAFVLTSGRHITAAFHGTPVMVANSFGIFPMTVTLGHLLHHDLTAWASNHRAADGFLALLLLAFGGGIGLVSRRAIEKTLPSLECLSFRSLMGCSCAAIYLFAFAAGASFNYRLIFLFGTLALLLESYDEGNSRVIPFASLIMIYIALPGRFVAIHELCDLLVYLWFSAWMAVFVTHALRSVGVPTEASSHPMTQFAS